MTRKQNEGLAEQVGVLLRGSSSSVALGAGPLAPSPMAGRSAAPGHLLHLISQHCRQQTVGDSRAARDFLNSSLRRANAFVDTFSSVSSASAEGRDALSEESEHVQQPEPSTSGSSSKEEYSRRVPLTAAGAPRLFNRAHVAPTDDGAHEVLLDSKKLKTPAGKPVAVPTKLLALAIAAEWEWQEGRTLKPFTMPLMKLATISIDQMGQEREKVIKTLIKYFHTDAILFRAPEGTRLADAQVEIWDPIRRWLERQVGAEIVTTPGFLPEEQSATAVQGVESLLRAASNWELSAIESLAGSARSLAIGLAVARRHLTIQEAVKAVRLEEDHQVEEWGFVEGGHDIDIADLRVRIAAPSVFLRLLDKRLLQS